MLKTIWQKSQSHLLAIGIFLIVSVIYCLPAMKGMVVNQSDGISWRAMAQQSFEYKEKHGHFPLWTNSMFSGMPTYQIAADSKYPFTLSLGYLSYPFKMWLPDPAGLFFLSCICFYILCIIIGLRPWISIFGALAYAFCSYNAILAEVGHVTKFAAMGYAPGVLGGFILLTQRKYILGFCTTLLFTTLLLGQNHIQIAYYTVLIVFCLAVAFVIDAIRKKEWRHMLITGSTGLTAAVLAGGTYASTLIPLNDYAKETMRGGKSELTLGNKNQVKTSGGLDKDYAFTWSYGIAESLTIALPAFSGGSSGPVELGDKSKAAENLIESAQQAGIPENYINQLYGLLSSYWGPQRSGTSGPVYFGVFIVFLAISGLFLIRNWHLYWIVAASLVGFILAWGQNLSSINYFLFDHLPYYNKFRSPSMALVIPQLTFALLAAMALQEILYNNVKAEILLKKLKPVVALAVLLGLSLTAFYFSSDFKGPGDKDRKESMTRFFTQVVSQSPGSQSNPQAMSTSIFNGLSEDRRSLYGKDLIRFWVLAALGILIIYYSIQKKISGLSASIACTVILFGDLITVDNRYLSQKNYLPNEDFTLSLEPTPADLQIKQDTSYYRVFDNSGGDPFNDSRGAYHHNLVNGYHPAKLALYQDLIEHQIAKNNMMVMNMLNTKYFLISDQQTQQPRAIPNPDALGACWLVKNLQFVETADQEMLALDSIKPLDTAYLSVKERSLVPNLPKPDSNATIRIIKNDNDIIQYESQSTTDQFAVFSEIYYPRGWKAFIDGKESPILKVNYCFRGIALPAGKHAIEFRFEPRSKELGDLVSTVINNATVLLFASSLLIEWRRKKNPGTPEDKKSK